MRISDWSSDVCSSDLETDEQALVREFDEELGVVAVVGDRLGPELPIGDTAVLRVYLVTIDREPSLVDHDAPRWLSADELHDVPWIDRKSLVWGKSASVSVVLGGRRILITTTKK